MWDLASTRPVLLHWVIYSALGSFETGACCVAQVGLEFKILLLCLLSAVITDLHHHAQFYELFKKNFKHVI
jgi:hypothetical protein